MISLTWFNYNKVTDWRVNSSATSIPAFKPAVTVGSGGTTPPPPPTPASTLVPPADTTTSKVRFSSPFAGSTIFRKLTVIVLASDNVGVKRVELYLDGRLLSTDIAAPYYFYLNTRTYTAGCIRSQPKRMMPPVMWWCPVCRYESKQEQDKQICGI